jgi:hypothetical protein
VLDRTLLRALHPGSWQTATGNHANPDFYRPAAARVDSTPSFRRPRSLARQRTPGETRGGSHGARPRARSSSREHSSRHSSPSTPQPATMNTAAGAAAAAPAEVAADAKKTPASPPANASVALEQVLLCAALPHPIMTYQHAPYKTYAGYFRVLL